MVAKGPSGRGHEAKVARREALRARRSVARSATGEPGPVRADGKSNPRTAFAARLKSAMAEKGIGTTELARQVRNLLPGNRLSPVLVSQYRSGRSLPRAGNLEALSHILGVEPGSLLPGPGLETGKAAPADRKLDGVPAGAIAPGRDENQPARALFVEARGDRILVQINQELPWAVGLAVLSALKGTRG